MSDHDPEVLAALLPAAEGDPEVEAYLRAAHAERGMALDRFQREDFVGAKRHVEAARGAVDGVIARWFVQQRKVFRGEVVEFGGVLLEDMALIESRLDGPREEIVALLERALGIYQRVEPGGDGEARCLSMLAEVYERAGDYETAREYFRRALELGAEGGTPGERHP
jgi:tetratricopeptide (TPR) repeat protein